MNIPAHITIDVNINHTQDGDTKTLLRQLLKETKEGRKEMARTVQEFQADMNQRFQAMQDADAAEHEQVTAAIQALKDEIANAPGIPDDVSADLLAKADAAIAGVQNIFTPETP